MAGEYDEDKSAWAQGPAITPAGTAAGATPTNAEFDALVGKFNTLLTYLRDAGILATD